MSSDYVEVPFTILVDTREQLPYRFQGYTADARDKHVPLVVRTEKATLQTGDYTIKGLEHKFTIERKSIDDAYSTFTHDHERFKRELERMRSMDFAAVVIESSEDGFYSYIATQTGGSIKATYRMMRYWPVDYGVHFLFSGCRDRAERDTLRMMQRFWKNENR